MSLTLKIPSKIRKPRKTGLPPGTLIHRGEQKTEKSVLDLIQYSPEELLHTTVTKVSQIDKKTKPGYCHWINVDGLHNINLIKDLGHHYSLNPLMLEDILNTEQRPKLDAYDDVLFFPMKMMYLDENLEMETEQFSLVLGDDYVLSFREKESDFFKELISRIKNPESRLRQQNNNYLFYSLVDTLVDSYFVVLDDLSDDVESIEEEVFFKPTSNTLKRIQTAKKELIHFRRTLYPTRDALLKLQEIEHSVINDTTTVYFNDILDHLNILIDTYESCRDLVANLMDTYMTLISNRMNEIMKVLTIISTIFIPLSFIAGVYGMNFDNMPELSWKYGYFLVLGVMFAAVIGMLFYFRRKHWI